MLRSLIVLPLLALGGLLHAQPDSLYVAEAGTMKAYAVRYGPMPDAAAFTRIGTYAYDTTRTAVRLGYKRGKPCGTYRAYYPDGKPLIFAVYGWGWLHGDWTEYDEFGRITVKGQYREGKRDGTWAFRADGIVGHYKNGLKNGKWKYYENGKVVRVEKYRKDQLLQGSRYHFGR
ncbi:MAG: hypothetical protein QM724_11330 [Flavobacteriales bacterium]